MFLWEVSRVCTWSIRGQRAVADAPDLSDMMGRCTNDGRESVFVGWR